MVKKKQNWNYAANEHFNKSNRILSAKPHQYNGTCRGQNTRVWGGGGRRKSMINLRKIWTESQETVKNLNLSITGIEEGEQFHAKDMDIFDKILKNSKSREIAIQPDTKDIWSAE